MKGLEEGFRGRPMSGLPDELVTAVMKSGHAPLPFRLKQGDPDAFAEALRRVQDGQEKTEERLLLVRALGEVRHQGAVTTLLAVASGSAPPSLRKAAFGALSAYDNEAIGREITTLLPALTGDLQTAALTLLVSRPTWSLQVLDALQLGKVKAAGVPEDIADRLRRSRDDQVRKVATRLLPEPKHVTTQSQQRIDQVHAILKSASGNPYDGEATFLARCAACHKLFFKGGNVGPDLTAYQRDNLSTMLLSIIDPGAEIREGFQYFTVETKDGRSLSGFFVDRDNQVTILRGLDGENITLRSSEIIESKPTGRSLMPDGLLDGLTDQELRDLFAYLRISQPITN